VRIGGKAGWSKVGISNRKILYDLGDDGRAVFRGGNRCKVSDGAEGTGRVGVLGAWVHVKQLGRTDEDDQNDAEKRKQNPEGLTAWGASLDWNHHGWYTGNNGKAIHAYASC